MKTGLSGAVAQSFLNSKLTPLLIGASIVAGLGGLDPWLNAGPILLIRNHASGVSGVVLGPLLVLHPADRLGAAAVDVGHLPTVEAGIRVDLAAMVDFVLDH